MGCVSSVPDYLATVGLASATGHARLLIGVVNSIYWVGVTVGALVVGWLSDRVGRRRALVAFGLYGLLAIPLLAALRGFAWALALRLLNGLFTGAFDSVGLNWAAESVDARRRGVAIGAQLACAAGGAGIVYFITYGLSRSSTGDVIWRLPMAFQLVYVLLVLAMVYFLPESPRWLVKVGLLDEARAVLRLLKAGLAGDGELGDAVEDDLRSIQNAIDEERAHSLSASYWDMFTRRDRVRTARRTWTALLVQFGTQAFVGASVVAGYGVAIFEAGGWPSQTAALLTGIGILTQAIFGVPGAVLSDRIGRRRAMVYGAAICATILALVGMCGFFVDKYKDTDPHKAKNYGTATVALVLLWNAVYGSTWRKSKPGRPCVDTCYRYRPWPPHADRSNSLVSIHLCLGNLPCTFAFQGKLCRHRRAGIRIVPD